jgi:hypothetical protein
VDKVLDLIRPTRFKTTTTLVIAAVVYLYSWLKPRVMMYYVESSDFMADKPEFQKLFGDMFALIDPNLMLRITLQSTVTNGVVLVLLSYLAACVIAKFNMSWKGP